MIQFKNQSIGYKLGIQFALCLIIGGIVKTKIIAIICSSALLVLGFQNCSQKGGLNLVSDPGLKMSSAGSEQLSDQPLVIEVVDAIEDLEQEQVQAPEQVQTPEQVQVPEVVQEPEQVQVPEQVQAPEVVQEPAQEPVPEHIIVNTDGEVPQNPVVATPESQPEQPVYNNVEEVLENNSCGKNKVLICHFPPGNAAAKHTICIAQQALKAHMDHGHGSQDHVGACAQ